MYYVPRPKCPFRTDYNNQRFKDCDWDECDFCSILLGPDKITYFCIHPVQVNAGGIRKIGYEDKNG